LIVAIITSEAQNQAWAKRRDRAMFEVLAQAMRMSLDEIMIIMAATTAFENVTGNLRSSIGHPGPIKASKKSLGLGRPPMTRNVVITSTGIMATLPIGMEYSPHVQERTGFANQAMDASPAIFMSNLSQAGAMLERLL